jgi:DNA-binding IscR family transcriptional regulator
MSIADDVEAALAGREDVVAVGVDADLLAATLAARRGGGGRWRVACPPGVVDDLGRALALGSAAAEACARGTVALRTGTGPRPDRPLFASAGRVDAVVGPADDRTLLSDADPDRATAAVEAVETRFETADPASIGMPSRTCLVAAAREALDDRFADDLATVLSTLGTEPTALDRSDALDDRTLLVALAARHDHLFADVREWADDVGIAPKQTFSAARRALEERGLVESIKVPMGIGRPNYRLRAVDETLYRVDAERFPSALRELFEAADAGGGVGRVRADDRPVWDRRR